MIVVADALDTTVVLPIRNKLGPTVFGITLTLSAGDFDVDAFVPSFASIFARLDDI